MEIPPHEESPLVLVLVKDYNQVADFLQQTIEVANFTRTTS